MSRPSLITAVFAALAIASFLSPLYGQAPPADQKPAIEEKLEQLRERINQLKKSDLDDHLLADVEVYAKAAEWILRHEEFYKPEYAKQTLKALDTGLARVDLLKNKQSPWEHAPGRTIRGYQSSVDESYQPYALSLPESYRKESEARLPLHLVLHGRGATLNEVSFIQSHDGKPAAKDQNWIQVDVFGRTNNAYRWSGESDVFEAFDDVRRRYRVDENRVVLHGFSMGGAGSWHLGLHHPSKWCSVGPGAGFVDFYKYQKVTEPLPFYQDLALHIYNPVDYAMNAFNVPVCTYGGELDPQLAASQEMVAAAEKLGVRIKMLIGPKTEHKFHPDSQKEFMAFHQERQTEGRKTFPGAKKIRFVTYTLKYNTCDWLTVEEMIEMYRPAMVEASLDEENNILKVKTQNVAVLQIARDLAPHVELDGNKLPLLQAAEGLLPGVYYEFDGGGWRTMTYDASLGFPKNTELRKRHNLQGPIDDAFMQPFVCVRGTGTPWSAAHAEWANWNLTRFETEFDKWLRGRIRIINDKDVTSELMADKNLILFGDPGSNSYLATVLSRLPLKWTKQSIEINGEKYDPATHGVSLIHPNPMNPRRYIVINSGHTMHEEDFKKSNAWLFPRLGDIAVQKFEKSAEGGYKESVQYADFFNGNWKLPSGLAPKTTGK